MKLTIKTKLYGYGLLSIILTLIIGYFGYRGIEEVGHSLFVVCDEEAPLVDMANEMRLSLMTGQNSMEEFKSATSALATSSDTQEREEIASAYRQTLEDFDTFTDAILEGSTLDGGMVVIKTDNDELANLVRRADEVHNTKFQVAAESMMNDSIKALEKVAEAGVAMAAVEQLHKEVLADSEIVQKMIYREISERSSGDEVGAKARAILSEEVPLLSMALELMNALNQSRIPLEEFVKSSDPEDLDDYERKFAASIVAFDECVAAILDGAVVDGVQVIATDNDEVRAAIEEIDENHTEFQQQAAELMTKHRMAIEQVAASDRSMAKLDAAGAEASAILNQVEQTAGEEMTVAKANGASARSTATTMIISVIIISVIAGVLIGLFLTRSITSPIGVIIRTLFKMTDGDGDLTLRLDTNRSDELGQINTSINEFVEAIQTANAESLKVNEMMRQMPTNVLLCDQSGTLMYMNETAQKTFLKWENILSLKVSDMIGKTIDIFHKDLQVLQRHISSPRQNLPHAAEFRIGDDDITLQADAIWGAEGEFIGCMVSMTDVTEQKRMEQEQAEAQQRERAAAKELQEKVDQLLVVAVRAGEGDLTESAPFTGEDSMGQLADGFGNMIESISKVISDVSSGSSQIDQGSQQISQSSQDLSEGASQQAANLEQISSSLEEMSSMTSQNAENAKQAATLSAESQTAADLGTAEMGKMSTAMDEIKKSSDEIAKVIKVIDEIAFQTNLLALNAAVEAARAGEAGKGFAVVAEEVRNLAQRSAEAAKETSTMIDESTGRANAGVEIAGRVGEVLGDIETSTKKVNTLLGEIASASREQADGVDQINKGVTELDKVTQQTAGNSEELAAAAEETASQVGVLRELVTRFKIKGESEASGLSATGRPSPSLRSTRGSGARKARMVRSGAGRDPDPRQVIPLDDGDFESF